MHSHGADDSELSSGSHGNGRRSAAEEPTDEKGDNLYVESLSNGLTSTFPCFIGGSSISLLLFNQLNT